MAKKTSEKTVYKKELKNKVQEILANGMTKEEIEILLATDNVTMVDRIAYTMALNSLSNPKSLEMLTKLTGDLVEEVNINTNNFTELIRDVSGEDEF